MEVDRVQDKGYLKGKGKGKKGKDSFGQTGMESDQSSGKGGKGEDDKSSTACLFCGKLKKWQRKTS